MIKRLCQNLKHLITIVGLCAILTACDGGIFGTGDGSDPLNTDEITAASVDASDTVDTEGAASNGSDAGSDAGSADGTTADSANDVTDSASSQDTGNAPAESPSVIVPNAPATDGEADGESAATDAIDAEQSDQLKFTSDFVAREDAVLSVNGQLSFTNSIVLNESFTDSVFFEDSSGVIVMVNDTDMTIGIFTSQDNDAIALDTVESDGGAFAVVQPSNEPLFFDEIDENGRRINQVVIDPISLVDGSISLAVLSDTEIGVRLLVVPAFNTDITNGAIPQRFVFPFLSGDPAVPSTFTLEPDSTAEGASELTNIVFDPVSNNLPVTNFHNIPPGRYLLSDDAGRFSNVQIAIEENDPRRTIVFLSGGFIDRASTDF